MRQQKLSEFEPLIASAGFGIFGQVRFSSLEAASLCRRVKNLGSTMADREYFERRAEQERAAAIAAKDPAACRVHMELAKEYDFRAAMEPVDDVEPVASQASISPASLAST